MELRDGSTKKVPTLPGEWEWRSGSIGVDKTVIHFGKDVEQEGGWLGEIDNWINSEGQEIWTLHVREIIKLEESGRIRPSSIAETSKDFDTLEEAISTVPEHINTYYLNN